MENFFKVKNKTDKSIDVYIYGEISSDADYKWDESEVMPKDIMQVLEENKGKDINLFINSPGGSVFAGNAIASMLKRHDGFITAHVDGVAASIASVIALSADRVIIPKNAFLMVHRAWTGAVGNAADMRKAADTLDRIDEGILNVYKGKLKESTSIDSIKEMVDNETWLTGEAASEFFDIETGDELEAVATIKGDIFNSFKNAPSEISELKEDEEIIVEKESKSDEISSEKIEETEIENLLMMIDLI